MIKRRIAVGAFLSSLLYHRKSLVVVSVCESSTLKLRALVSTGNGSLHAFRTTNTIGTSI